MGFAPALAGPHDPVPTTVDRAPGSVRRTTTIDTNRPDGFDGLSVIDARGRDLATDPDGGARRLDFAHLQGRVDPARVLVDLAAGPLAGTSTTSARPDDGALAALAGARVAGGFRGRLATTLADLPRSGSVWFQLLDDLPGANLVSGAAQQHAEAKAGGGPMAEGARAFPDLILAQADICAGWTTEGLMLTEFRTSGDLPAPQGPLAPTLERTDDDLAWHQVDPLGPHGTRRRRRLDVGPTSADGTAWFDGHFRDSHLDGDGVEWAVHEYTVAGVLDVAGGQVIDIVSQARVLPWVECPAALGSAARIVGVPLDELRRFVRADLTGVSTCTHLNDTLRSLADLGHLLSLS